MENIEILMIVLLGGGMGLLMLATLIKYLLDYFSDIKYVKMEVDRADDWNEYVYWRRELSALRWSIIPGLTPDRVKRIKKVFYRGKYAKKCEKSDGFTSLLIPSVLGIFICAVCLVGGTFAWFTASQEVFTQTIQSARYTVEATVTLENGTPITAENGVYRLEKSDTAYKVTLTATGDATTGYCIIDLGGTDIHTVQFPSADNAEKSITFDLMIHQPVDMKIIPQWGSSTKDDDSRIANGNTYTHGGNTEEIGTPPTEETGNETTVPPDDTTTPETTLDPTQYVVQSGDTLGKIANLYGTTIEKLKVYNAIANANQIRSGQTIKIPPANWQIPYTTKEETAPPTTTEPEATETESAETKPTETEPKPTEPIETEPTETTDANTEAPDMTAEVETNKELEASE